MNDFTKEELELIESYFIKEDVVPDKPYIHLSLLRKIQYMIGHNIKPEKLMWISVEDYLPPDGQEVLTIYKHKIGESRSVVGYLLENEWHYCVIFQSYAVDYFGVTITHWMELPDYPIEK